MDTTTRRSPYGHALADRHTLAYRDARITTNGYTVADGYACPVAARDPGSIANRHAVAHRHSRTAC